MLGFFISNEYLFLDISVGGHENSRLACCSLSLSSIYMTTAIIGEEYYYETDYGTQRISDNNLLQGANRLRLLCLVQKRSLLALP